MGIVTSKQSGLWSDVNTWDTGIVPVNGDTVTIVSGHTVTFDVDQSSFANGLALLTINGVLNFKVDVITYLKMNGNIAGTGTLQVGNSESDPIQRPPVGTEARCQIILASTAYITVPNVIMFGWHPDKEYTQLSGDVALNGTQLILNEDLEIQQGDLILISSGTEDGQSKESNLGTYTVSSYDSATKTVTLTSGVQTARLKDDYVAIYSRPIKLSRISGNKALITSDLPVIELEGVRITGCYVVSNPNYVLLYNGGVYKHCSEDRQFVSYAKNAELYNCVVRQYQGIFSAYNGIIEECIGIFSVIGAGILTGSYKNNIAVGVSYSSGALPPIENSKLLQIGKFMMGASMYLNCIISSIHTPNQSDIGSMFCYCNPSTYINCNIKGTPCFGDLIYATKTYNCLFEQEEPITYYKADFRPNNVIALESFDHNQIKGNYAAWMRGGRIKTDSSLVNANSAKSLKFICENADAPVFKDYDVLLPANKSVKIKVNSQKDFTGGTVKLQLIDPANDPLIDDEASPLNEITMQDVQSAWKEYGIIYKSTVAKQAKIRIISQNTSGNVWFDVSNIESLLKTRETFLSHEGY